MVQADSEGVGYWACYEKDLSANGAIGRNMSRMLEDSRLGHIKSIVRYLPPHLVKKMRAAWEVKRDFDFISENKITSIYTDNRDQLQRPFYTLVGLARELGDVNNEWCKEKAWDWACGRLPIT